MFSLSGSSFREFEGHEGNLGIQSDRHAQGNLLALARPLAYVFTFWVVILRLEGLEGNLVTSLVHQCRATLWHM